VSHGARRATIQEVATAAGVSKTSVSFAFNTPDRLRPETLIRIRDAAAALGYRPRTAQRTLARRRQGTIAIVAPHSLGTMFANPNFGEFAAGALTESEAAGYTVQLVSPFHGSLAKAVDRASVAGVIAIGIRSDGPEIAEIEWSGLPFVTVDSAPSAGITSVNVDDEAGARAAADHVLGLGHRDIVILSLGPFPSATGSPWTVRARRMAGYSSALEAGGIILADEDVVFGEATVEGGADAFRRAWDAGRRPTAVLAMSDAMAIGVFQAARELELRIPSDLSVVGFDDIEVARYTDPPLTTVHQPARRKGEEAVRLLLAHPPRRGDGLSRQRMLETRLVIRGSTAAPSGVANDRPGRRRRQPGGRPLASTDPAKPA
jgi:DNA-binding LacI/PurR family transcriptional regulator